MVLGGYFRIRERGRPPKDCGKIDQHSVYLERAMEYAISKINANKKMLFGLNMGYVIKETCGRMQKRFTLN